MMRLLYDLRSPRERGIVPDERMAAHRAELHSQLRERRESRSMPRPTPWWRRGGLPRPQAPDLSLRVIELQHRIEHLERRLSTLSQRCPSG